VTVNAQERRAARSDGERDELHGVAERACTRTDTSLRAWPRRRISGRHTYVSSLTSSRPPLRVRPGIRIGWLGR
jgi:hypothetical protein